MTLATINPAVVECEYAVRGALAIRAEELKKEIAAKGRAQAGFRSITSCNIGNPQQLGQTPITFFRQVAALIEYPNLLDAQHRDAIKGMFAPDAIERAQKLLKAMGGSVGAYTHSQGIPLIRENVAKFIEERDGYPSDPNDIFLTAGASPGVQLILQTLIAHEKVGIMIPIPQYPLYTASIALFKGNAVPYYLEEETNWGLKLEELERAHTLGKSRGHDIRALCVINPGNPTGGCLSVSHMKQIIEFCHREKLVLLADEVYQTNTYMPETFPFHSFKKILMSMGPPYSTSVELISFHSISKGVIGECGRRGGYLECTNIDPKVKDMFYKVASISLCPPAQGQVMVDLMVRPPREGDESWEGYRGEVGRIYASLQKRAAQLAEAFNKLEGVSCQPAQGAMYLFPQIHLPEKAIAAAKKAGVAPDELYCMELLNATGVCVVPGSGFHQKSGTWHFRSTFLPPEEQMGGFIRSIQGFHEGFLKRYA
ncbi:pyridoxal phosphate-dependent transferase [Fimicolochytrium jonesii]|uniref:pyridoxal phosphate-dependent transferase n=1 Tax=Fimicolochytrium jonesii TaxID=1396493 RepID=UPI0022FE7EDE|nr:pyridoxal phosphate-dependent transferase [Fimicolochytrium jonesii]KAI8824035.1 pyridoxal phosphate-dependent transferase [Fimicolochytrium jonesii]